MVIVGLLVLAAVLAAYQLIFNRDPENFGKYRR